MIRHLASIVAVTFLACPAASAEPAREAPSSDFSVADGSGAERSGADLDEPKSSAANTSDAEDTAADPNDAQSSDVDVAGREEAAERFARGLRFYEDGDYRLALIEFERAYELVPNYRVLYNIGQVAIQLGRFARARHALEKYLELGGPQLSEERRRAVEADMEMLGARTAHLDVSTTPPGAQVLVDDVPYGVTPLEGPLLLDAGEHTIVLRLEGHQNWSRRITLAGAEELELQAVLAPEEDERQVVIVQQGQQTPVAPPQIDQSDQERGPSAAAIGWTTTGALAAGAIFSGVMGLVKAGDFQDLKNTPNTAPGDLQAHASETSNWFLATDILAATAAVAAGVSLYLTLKKPAAKVKPAEGSASSTSMRLGLSPRQVVLTGTF